MDASSASHGGKDFKARNIGSFPSESPLSLGLNTSCKNTGKAFRFFNCIKDHPKFLQIVEQACQRHKRGDMKTIWWKFKKVKIELKELNNSEFKSVKDKIKYIREQLHTVQTDMIDHNVVPANREQEKELRKQLEKWNLVEKSAIRQKSRVAQNTITNLTTVIGTIVYSQESIEEEALKFYQGLLGQAISCLPSVDTTIMRRGGMLNKDQQIQITATVTRIDVETTLQSISDLKAPGID
ncbi:hypothetical protein KY285_032702 [Solanum tuberosum]|nr:hypothetical protein KY285_032702 [Solanum tuberosum]